MNNQQLPEPEAEALAVSQALSQVIAEEIRRDGPIPFDRYCEMALYQPGLGYYAAGARKFGSDGDFVTAPELGDIFARCLATPVHHTLEQVDDGEVLELGAGSGQLACDLLTELERLDWLPRRYRILEVSADLRQRQKERLEQAVPHLMDRIQWLEQAPSEPFAGVILGNEVVDALPARRFRKSDSGWTELRVDHDGDRFDWQVQPADADQLSSINILEDSLELRLPIGYVLELQPQLQAWVKTVTAGLTRGRVIMVDYGYPRLEFYHPDRARGTLMCHYRHRAHDDPFWYPGLSDISVNVEFTALAEALAAADFDVDGLANQVRFLIGCGLGSVVGESTEAITKQRVLLIRQVQMLTQPGEMGERFLVLTAARGVEGPPPGYQSENRLDRL